MGYACPVCEEPQQDAEHLANHLAFQAMTHADDHESWLDEHAPDWAIGGPADLAPRVADLAREVAYEVVFDDTTDGRAGSERYDPDLQGEPHTEGQEHEHGHRHQHQRGRPHPHPRSRGAGQDGERGPGDGDAGLGDLDPETRTVVAEARELTREMLTEDDGGESDADEEIESDTHDGDESDADEGEDEGDDRTGSDRRR
jgi:hypothetical protein